MGSNNTSLKLQVQSDWQFKAQRKDIDLQFVFVHQRLGISGTQKEGRELPALTLKVSSLSFVS
jgi:hypothetical protein